MFDVLVVAMTSVSGVAMMPMFDVFSVVAMANVSIISKCFMF